MGDDEKEITKGPTASSNVAASASSLDRMYVAMLQSCKASLNADKNVCELDHYLQEPVCEEKQTNPMVWWVDNGTRLPKLAKLVRKYLGTPTTSVSSERVFSTVGLTYDHNRCSLLGTNAEKLCFLN